MSRINTWKKYRELCGNSTLPMESWTPDSHTCLPCTSALPHICPLPSGFLLWPSDHFCPSLASLSPSSPSAWLSAYCRPQSCRGASSVEIFSASMTCFISAVVHLKQLDKASFDQNYRFISRTHSPHDLTTAYFRPLLMSPFLNLNTPAILNSPGP